MITLYDCSALDGEAKVRSIHTVAIGAFRFRWDQRVDAASREGTAYRARYELRRGIGAVTRSRLRWTRFAEGLLETGICGFVCSDSLE